MNRHLRACVDASVVAFFVAVLAGCASGPPIDRSNNAIGQDSRVRFLVLHYTAIPFDTSLRVLTQQEVSSHYLVDDQSGKIYGLVDENRRAYHAGVSYWRGVNNLNFSSIGIEIVNEGYKDGPNKNDAAGRTYFPFPPQQIDAVLALTEDIVKRHKIAPANVIGHSDIAPQRKPDPGPLFPWKRFAERGLILWPAEDRVALRKQEYEAALALPDAAWFQKRLGEIGYLVPTNGQFDKETVNVIAAFQMKYRPARFDGVADAETAAMIDILTSMK